MIFQHRLSADLIQPDMPELFRYAGFSKQKLSEISDSQMEKLGNEAAREVSNAMNCRSLYTKFPLVITPDEEICFADKKIKSHHLAINLENCHSVVLFAATLGPAVDKLIQKTSRINAAKAVMLQAAGAMYIERYCDLLQDFFREEEAKDGNCLKPRYSPGFGDVPLEIQKTFFELLQCQKNLALTLNDSLIMSPEKSVTAFVGVYKKS